MTRRSLLSHSLWFALRQGRWEQCCDLLDQQTRSGQVSAATLFVRHQSTILQQAFGQAKTADAVFLPASITKPMTATALMVLVDRRQVSLSDPVQRFLPEFRGDGRERVSV
jgi:beta-lactamase class C